MARIITAPELAHLRSDGQRCELFLAVHTPASVFTARLKGAPASTDGVYEIDFDGGSAGFADCIAGQTVYIGSTAGAYDVGMARLRGAVGGVSGTMEIGEASEIDWTDNDYITVVDEFALWPRHLRIDGGGTVYVDYDVSYTDQHEVCDPVPVLGPPAVKWLTGATVDVEFDASDSWVSGSTISAYSWTATGASATSGMATATPTITYDTAGTYRVSCLVTATNGATFTGYRYVFVYDTNSQPATIFRLDDCSGDWQSGGWRYRVTMWDEALRSEIRDRAQVILFARDWYGDTETSIGPVDDRENVVAVGWIADESIKWNPRQGIVSFDIQSPQFWMGKMTGFPTGVEDYDGTPTSWIEFEDLTVDKGLWHFLHWRTTATLCMDVTLTSDTRQVKVFDSPASSLWAQITQESKRTILAHPACDRYGRLFVEIDQNLIPVADRGAIPIVQTLATQDWREQIGIERKTVDEIALLDLSGVAYAGGSGTPYFSLSPGHVFRRYGSIQRKERLALNDQADTNTLTGLLAGKANNEYPNLDISLASNHRMLDICPQQYLRLTIAEGDTERGISFTNLDFIPRRVSFRHDPDTGVMLTDVTVEAYTTPELAVTGDPPPAPPDPADPELPPVPIIPPVPPLWTGPVKAAFAHTQTDFGYTADLLLRHVDSTATAGTAGTDLYDTSIDDHPGEDFDDIGVAVGDHVENLTTHEGTTVAVAVSGSQLTLTADIGLGNGDAYAIAGTHWVDASGGDFNPGVAEEIIQFVYIRTGAATVGGWVLTDAAAYYAANVLTSSPSWSNKLTLAAARVLCGGTATFAALAVDANNPLFAIVSMDDVDAGALNSAKGSCVTGDTGENWSVGLYESPDKVNHLVLAGRTGWRALAVDNNDSTIYAIRGFPWPWTNPKARKAMWVSTNGGVSFTTPKTNISTTQTGRVFILARGGTVFVVPRNPWYGYDPGAAIANPLKTGDGGGTFASVSPVGYTDFGIANPIGHYDDADDLVCLFDRTTDGKTVISRSSDGGGTFTVITDDIDVIIDENIETRTPVLPAGWPWPPDSDILGMINAIPSAVGALRKIFYSDDNGVTFFNKTTDFVASVGGWDWGHNGERCGFMPLPRVGANE